MNTRILVIDDNYEIHEDIKKILQCPEAMTELDELELEILGTSIQKNSQATMVIDSALQGDEAVDMGFKAWKEGNAYALAFVDIRMPPGLNGIETIKKIREFDKDLQFVIITAYSDYNLDQINSATNSQGNILILKKPFDSIEIRQLASALTEKWTLSRENQEKSRILEEMNQAFQSEIQKRKELEINQKKLLLDLDARIKELNCLTIEQIRAEERVKESESKIRLIMDSTAEGIYGLDLEGRCIFCNRASIKILGYTEIGDLIGKQMHNLIHHTKTDGSPYGSDECLILKSCRTTYKFHSDQEVFWKKDNTCFNVKYRAYPMFKDKEIVGVVVTFIDITEQIQAAKEKQRFQTQLQQAQKMEAIGILAGGIAHDFNNILMPLMGYTELLKEDLPSNTHLQGYIDEIFQAALRAKDLVQQILTFSSQAEHELKQVKIQVIVKETLKLLRAGISTNIEIRKHLDPDCGMVVVDPTQIHQIIMNLATNAFHSMEKDGGIMTITLEQIYLKQDASRPGLVPGLYACLTIADTGIGIKKEILEKVFDPYYTTKEKGKGTGLGLSVVRGIVKNYKGDIIIDSEEGKGTRICVYLPIAKSVLIPVEDELSEIIPRGTEKILLVDDESSIVNIQRIMLGRLGYGITTFTKSLEALEMFTKNPYAFDLVLTDMNMPNMTGVQLMEKIKRVRPDIPVILCTGYNNQILAEKYKSPGADGYVLKPVIKREIACIIREVLNKKNQND